MNNKTVHREDLEKLSTQELDKILRAELDSENPKKELVLLVLSILEERDPTTSQNRLEGTEEAFAGQERKAFAVESVSGNKKKWSFPKWLGVTAAVVAIAFVLLATVPQAVGAESIFDIIGKWTENLFSFSDGTDTPNLEYVFKTENEGLQQLYDAVVAQGVTDPVVPMWIPEGYKLEELKVFPQPLSDKIYACFLYDNYYVIFTVEIYDNSASNDYPKDLPDVITTEIDGVVFYTATNEDTHKAMWKTAKTECAITTNSTEEMYRILDSIIAGG